MKIDLEYTDTIGLKPLAFALLVKDTYVSSAVTNYNPYSLQQKLREKGFNFHHSTISRYVSVLLDKKLAIIRDDTLIIKKMYSKFRAYVYIRKNESKTFKEYIHFIRFAILKRKIKQAKFVYNRKLFIIKRLDNPRDAEEYRQVKMLARKYDVSNVNGAGFGYKQSIQSLANLFNCSIGDLYTTIKFLVSNRYLEVKKDIRRLSPCFSKQFQVNGCFVWNGWLYSVDCNTYILSSS